jgi:Type II secretion system protein C
MSSIASPFARASRAFGWLALLSALALLAAVVASWGWRLLGPAALDFVPAAPQDPALALRASGLFAAPAGAGSPTAPPQARVAGPEIRLLGVLAEEGGGGYALVRLPGGPKLVAAGREIADGISLQSVQRDGVTVRDADGERRLVLRAATAMPLAKPVGRASPGNAACVPPAGFKGDVLRLNAELVGGIAAQPDTWTALAAPDRGAMIVRDDSGFAAMLAMKKGDRIEQANGIALRSAEDIAGAVLRPLASGQSVRLVGARAGAPREWLLQNAGTCP